MTFFCAVLSIKETAICRAPAAVSLSSASRTDLMAVRILERIALFFNLALRLVRSRFLEDFSLGKVALQAEKIKAKTSSTLLTLLVHVILRIP